MRYLPLPLTAALSAAGLAVVGASGRIQAWLADVSTGVDVVAEVLPREAWWALAALVALRTAGTAVSFRNVTTTERREGPLDAGAKAALDELLDQVDAVGQLVEAEAARSGDRLDSHGELLDEHSRLLDVLAKKTDALYGVGKDQPQDGPQ